MSTGRGRRRPLAWVALLAATTLGAAAAARRWLDVVEVRGRSMAPSLRPGDLLLVESLTYARRAPRPGEVVLAPDPRHPERELVKRVARVSRGTLELRGDAPEASTDSRTFGSLRAGQVRWRAVLRYWPPRRIGPVRAAAPALEPERLGGEPACSAFAELVAGEGG